MGRILFWVAFFAVIYAVIVVARNKRVKKETESPESAESGGSMQKMVRCPVCRVHFPESEAVLGDGLKFCSEKCRKQARADS